VIPSDDVRAALELDAVDHQHREAHVVEAPCHQRLQVLARAGDELAANRRLRGRAGVSLDLLADRLLGAREATRRDASEHPLEHHARERVAIGEVAVGGQRYLVASIGAARPRALDRHPAATERHLAGLVPVADGDTIRVVLAPRPDDLIDFLLHQLGQHAEPDADRQREQPLLRSSGQLPERLLHPLGQH
jgi:hypothetical protein